MKTYISKIDGIWYVYGVEDFQPHQVRAIPEQMRRMDGWCVASWTKRGIQAVGSVYSTKHTASECAKRCGDYAGEWKV